MKIGKEICEKRIKGIKGKGDGRFTYVRFLYRKKNTRKYVAQVGSGLRDGLKIINNRSTKINKNQGHMHNDCK